VRCDPLHAVRINLDEEFSLSDQQTTAVQNPNVTDQSILPNGGKRDYILNSSIVQVEFETLRTILNENIAERLRLASDEIIPYSESEINTLEEAPSFQNDS